MQDTIPSAPTLLRRECPPGAASLHNRLAWIQAVSLFRGLSPSQCAEIVATAREQAVPRRHNLFREGDPASSIFVIGSGLVKVTQLTESGKEIILRVQGSGDLVGGVELLRGRTHRSNAEAIESCQLLVWEASIFEAYWTRFPILLGNIAHILDEHLQQLEECFRDVATERVPQRVARTLLRLLEQSGGPTCKGPLHLSCEELAQMTGTTLFTVSRLLCQWVEWGILEPQPRAVMVGNLPALVNLAKGKEVACYSAETATADTGAQMREVANVGDIRSTDASRTIVA